MERTTDDASGHSGITSSDNLLPSMRYVVDLSWWLASELVRRAPQYRILEVHPGDGLYDVLALVDASNPAAHWEQVVIQLNRRGRIRVQGVDNFEPVEWAQVFHADDPHHYVKLLEDVRADTVRTTPSSTPTSLVYRIISTLLTKGLHDRPAWDARSIYRDGPSAGLRDGFVDAFPVVPSLLRGLAGNTASQFVPGTQLWVVTRGDEPVVVLDDRGFAHSQSGDVLELMPLYARRRSISDLGAAVLELGRH